MSGPRRSMTLKRKEMSDENPVEETKSAGRASGRSSRGTSVRTAIDMTEETEDAFSSGDDVDDSDLERADQRMADIDSDEDRKGQQRTLPHAAEAAHPHPLPHSVSSLCLCCAQTWPCRRLATSVVWS
jgi:hypothetical protein